MLHILPRCDNTVWLWRYGVERLGLHEPSSQRRRPIISCVARSWPSIAKWAKFYYEDKLSGGPVWTTPPKDKRIEAVAEAQALTVLAGVMAYASSSTGSAERLASDQGDTFTMIAKVWLRAVPHEHVDMEAKRRIMEIIKYSLSDSLNSPSKAWSLNLARNIIFTEAKKKVKVVANAALAFIKDAPSLPDVGAVFPSVNITYLLLCTNDKKDESSIFEKALVELDVSQIITRIFVHFSRPPNDTFRYAEGILNNSLQIILSLLESPRGFAQAPSMLKLGLLDGIANYTSNFYRTARSVNGGSVGFGFDDDRWEYSTALFHSLRSDRVGHRSNQGAHSIEEVKGIGEKHNIIRMAAIRRFAA